MARKTLRRGSAVAAIAAALLLTSTAGSSARWHGPWGAAALGAGVAGAALGAAAVSNAAYSGSYYDYGGVYDYVPDAGLSSSEVYRSRNGTPFGPPDPATCGGYTC